MPFLDSEIILSLYDTQNGGPPRAFECKICITKPKVTRTLHGMVQHLLKYHSIKIQLDIEGIENEKQEHKSDDPQS
jgi:hypothetical protein